MELENKDVVDRRVRRHRAEMVGERCRGREEAIKKTAVMSFVEKNRGLWRLRVFVDDQDCWQQVCLLTTKIVVKVGCCKCLLTTKVVGCKLVAASVCWLRIWRLQPFI